MLKTRRALGVTAAAAVASIAVAACGSSSSGGGSNGNSAGGNNGGKPVKGGTLTMLGVGDLDHVDSGGWYYTTDYELGNLITRQLLTYPRDLKNGIFGTDPVPDAADGMPTISSDKKTYTFKIKQGIKWNTSPARQVTADDFIRGIARTCNPVAPFGASSYFTSTIAGFDKFCTNELKLDTTASALSGYLTAHTKDITGMASSDNGATLTFHLIKPASDFLNIVALGCTSAVPKEYLQYAPDSAALGNHLLSDGPYKIDKYVRGKTISLTRNPAWDGSTDSNRPAYVDAINITENLQQEGVQQQIAAGTADMEWDTFPLPTQIARLKKQGDPNLVLSPTSSSNPYLVFNTVSPSSNGALGKVGVRQAISYGVDKSLLIQDEGGPVVNTQLNQVLPPVIKGGETQYEPYPFNVDKAKSTLKSAGYPNGVTLKLLYRNESSGSTKIAQTLQQELPKMGVKVKLVAASNADFYGKYLQVKPSVTKQGNWDIAIAGWGADWDGNSARTYFLPLFDGRTFAPSSSNFGDYNDPKVNSLDDQALAATSVDDAAGLWHKADQQVMADAPFIPITNPKTANYYNSKKVHGFVYWDNFQNGDPTNVWCDGGKCSKG